jgi:hypothetical protein
MNMQSSATMLNYQAEKLTYLAYLCRVNFFAVRLALFRTLAFVRLTFVRFYDVVA